MSEVRIMAGHVLERLKELPDGSVHMCCTSPPYWGLRSYKTEPQVRAEYCADEREFEEAEKNGDQAGADRAAARAAERLEARQKDLPDVGLPGVGL